MFFFFNKMVDICPYFRPHLKSGPSENQTFLTLRNLDILVLHFVEMNKTFFSTLQRFSFVPAIGPL